MKDRIIDFYNLVRYAIPRRIKKIIDYIPILWKDFDWDDSYLYILMRYKLSRMEKVIRKGYSIDAEKHANEILHAIELLDRIIDNDYCEKAFDLYDKKWGELDWIPVNGGNRLNGHVNAKTEEEKKQCAKEFDEIIKRERHLAERDWNCFWKFMRKHSLKWWD